MEKECLEISIHGTDIDTTLKINGKEDVETLRQVLDFALRHTLTTKLDEEDDLTNELAELKKIVTTIEERVGEIDHQLGTRLDEIDEEIREYSSLSKIETTLQQLHSELESLEAESAASEAQEQDEEGDVDSDQESESVGDFDSLDEFREENTVEERREYILTLIERYQPITTGELGKKLFGYKPDASEPEYREIANRVNDIKDLIIKEPAGRSTEYRLNSEDTELDSGARRIREIPEKATSATGGKKRIVCTKCRSEDAVFPNKKECREHLRETGHDSWVVASIPEQWTNGKTVEKVVETKLKRRREKVS